MLLYISMFFFLLSFLSFPPSSTTQTSHTHPLCFLWITEVQKHVYTCSAIELCEVEAGLMLGCQRNWKVGVIECELFGI